VLIISGALHYFQPLADLVGDLSRKPRSILINRTPLTDGPSVAVVQDAGRFRVACMLYNRDRLVADLEGLGYVLVDAWKATELSLAVPGDPDRRVDAYSGLFFELSSPPPEDAQPEEVAPEDMAPEDVAPEGFEPGPG